MAEMIDVDSLHRRLFALDCRVVAPELLDKVLVAGECSARNAETVPSWRRQPAGIASADWFALPGSPTGGRRRADVGHEVVVAAGDRLPSPPGATSSDARAARCERKSANKGGGSGADLTLRARHAVRSRTRGSCARKPGAIASSSELLADPNGESGNRTEVRPNEGKTPATTRRTPSTGPTGTTERTPRPSRPRSSRLSGHGATIWDVAEAPCGPRRTAVTASAVRPVLLGSEGRVCAAFAAKNVEPPVWRR